MEQSEIPVVAFSVRFTIRCVVSFRWSRLAGLSLCALICVCVCVCVLIFCLILPLRLCVRFVSFHFDSFFPLIFSFQLLLSSHTHTHTRFQAYTRAQLPYKWMRCTNGQCESDQVKRKKKRFVFVDEMRKHEIHNEKRGQRLISPFHVLVFGACVCVSCSFHFIHLCNSISCLSTSLFI